MYVRNSMTSNPYTIGPDANVAEALELMRVKKIRRVPVLKNGRLVGIITKQKLLEISPSPATTLSIYEIHYMIANTKIDTIMTKDVVTISSDSLLEEAAVIMKEKRIGGLPVVDDGKLVGIITETDIFNSFIEIMGFADHGSRITVDIGEDRPGILAKIAGIIAGFNISISHIVFFRDEYIMRLNTLNTDDIVKALEDSGFKVTSVLKFG